MKPASNNASGELAELRKRIDAIDREFIVKLNERAVLASEVGRLKQGMGADFYVPAREEQVFQKLLGLNKGPLKADAVRNIFREIISASIALEKQLVIGYLGPEATFTEQAARRNFGGSVTYQPLSAIPDVFTAVQRGEADYGVIPIENSTGGAVIHSLDMLAETDLKIIAQIYLPVEHCLIAGCPLQDVREVRSKDQALSQCRDWLARHLPKARQVETDSTAAAVRAAAVEAGVAAIAAETASKKYSVPILARGIQDRADNVTRFLVIGPRPAETVDGVNWRSSIVLSLNDEVGALEKALRPFSSRGINLTKIESRPSRRKAWDYLFFIDFSGHWEDAPIQQAVAELKSGCPFLKWLGSYPE